MNSSFRFLHAADIHLDSPLKGLAGHDEDIAGRVRTATREALEGLVDFAIDEKVDLLVIAGDLYDGDWRDYRTGLFFVRQMGRLNEAGIPVCLTYGNHDAESQLTRQLELPANVTAFNSRKAHSVCFEGLGAVVHGRSFGNRAVTDNLVPTYPEPASSMFNIGLLHTGLNGFGDHERYAPCSMHDLVNKGYDYWALGHVHKGMTLNENPHVVFPGNLQGRNAKENGTKGAVLVTVEQGNVANLETVAFDVVRWHVIEVQVGDADTVGEINDRICQLIELAIAESEKNRFLIFRILLVGQTELHGSILNALDDCLAQARAAALSLGSDVAWVEKLVVGTEDLSRSRPIEGEDAMIGDLRQLLADATDDEDFLKHLTHDIAQLVSRLPHAVRSSPEDPLLRHAIDCDYSAIVEGTMPYLSARLSTSGSAK